MTRARNFADVISGNFAIPSGSLGNAVPADGSITTAKLADDAITSAKIADDAVVAAAIADDAVTSAAIATNAVASDALNISRSDLPSGTVLQCVTVNYSDDFIFSLGSSGNAGDDGKMEICTGLNASITPTSTNSKILYQATIYIGGTLWYDIGMHIIKNATSTVGTSAPTTTSPLGGSYLLDSSGNAIRGQASGGNPQGTGTLNNYAAVSSLSEVVTVNYRLQPVNMCLLDHPNSTSQQTYHFAIRWYAWETNSLYINRSYTNADGSANDFDTQPVSTVVLTEIA